MKCGHSRNLFYVSRSCFSFSLHTFLTHIKINEIRVEISFLFDISKLLVAYKHTYFAQRNRMKCGHSRNLFYVSRSCFSFYLHTFVTHLNNWNTRWDFIFFSTFENYLWHINTLILHNGIEWNVVIVGTIFYVSRSCFSFYLHTFLTRLNKWNTRWDFIFIRHLKTTCGMTAAAGRPPALYGAARPAAGGRRPGQRGVPTLAAEADRERSTSAAARFILRVVELSYRPVTVLGCVSSSFVSVRTSNNIEIRTIWDVHVIFIVVHVLNTTNVAYKHTYFAQWNRMKCGHSRNLFYVSRSCFSFYLHTFVTHLNNWNTRWDFIFIRHLKTTCGI